jgi:hypothetical protein
MRYLALGMGLAALSAAAFAQQQSDWAFFTGDGGLMQAGVQSSEGWQFILKCDKAGKGSVYAVVVTTKPLVVTGSKNYATRPAVISVDGGPPDSQVWRFVDQFAMAVDYQHDRNLTRTLQELDGKSKLEIQLQPDRMTTVSSTFNVKGTREAAAKVFQSCKDTDPLTTPAG